MTSVLDKMKNGKTPFQKFSNIKTLDLNKTIESIEGLSHSTTSRTETWIINFNKEIQKEIRAKKGFMKICIDHKSFNTNDEDTRIFLKSYEIENKIYRYVNELLNRRITNNFIGLLTIRQGISLKDMVSIISEKNVNGVLLTKNNATKNFKRNILDSIKDFDEDIQRITIGKPGRTRNIDFSHGKKWRYSYIITEAVREQDIIMDEYFSSLGDTPSSSTSSCSSFNNECWNIIFQVSHACFIMEKFNIMHNDLHACNIWLRVSNTVNNTTYKVNENTFNIQSKFTALIYDFDRGYMEYNNVEYKNEASQFFEEFKQTSEMVKGRDFMRFLILLKYYIKDRKDINKIVECIGKNEMSKFKILYFFFKEDLDYYVLGKEFLNETMLDMENIMINLHKLTESRNDLPQNNVFKYRDDVKYM